MKLERLGENKVKITLSLEELAEREVTLKDIQTNSNIAKDLFKDLIEENNLDEDFVSNDSHLFIEAASDSNNLFTVTITKVENLPDYSNYQFHSSSKQKNRNSNTKKESKIKYTVDSNVYSFYNINDIIELCEKAKKEKLFFGKNSLYKFNNEYFLIFSKTSIKNSKFVKTYVFLSEYCKNYYAYDLYETSIKERAKMIIENNALQKLSKI
ncbi:negative regulator of genetic competence sporulation and motility [Clostridium sp. CAG:921]|nr:negative regulator of genetic competence sporulation and motility [Clostridium sp. CAG:921]